MLVHQWTTSKPSKGCHSLLYLGPSVRVFAMSVPYWMPKPPQMTPLEVHEPWLYFEITLDDDAPLPCSKTEPGQHEEQDHSYHFSLDLALLVTIQSSCHAISSWPMVKNRGSKLVENGIICVNQRWSVPVKSRVLHFGSLPSFEQQTRASLLLMWTRLSTSCFILPWKTWKKLPDTTTFLLK